MQNRLRNQLVLLLVFLFIFPAFASFPAAENHNGNAAQPEVSGKASETSQGRGQGRGRGIAPTMPDIALFGLNWSLSAPDDGAGLAVFATLFNDGTDIAQTFGVDVLIDGASAGSPLVSGLPGGSFTTVHVDWTVRPGPHEITAVADWANIVREANETNNLRVGYLDIPYPDLAIQNVSWYPQDYRTGDQVTFVATVHNAGSGGTSRPILLESYIDQFQLGNQIISGLGAGNTAQSSVRWTARPGNHTLFLSLDAGNQVRERTKANNRLTVRLGQDYPDMIISNATVAPADLVDGDIATFSATVQNIGRGNTTTRFPVGFLVDGDPAGSASINGLLANSSQNVSVRWTVRPGTHILRVESDPDGQLGEAVETNNFRLLEFAVKYPNLVVRDIRWERALSTDGRQVRFNITVANIGPGSTARGVQLELQVDGQPAGTTAVSGLGAGRQENLSANWTALPGRHEVRAGIDPGALIDEVDETDNYLVSEMDVPFPDIVLSNLTVSPPAPESGETVRISTIVSNPGAGNTSRPFTVSIYAAGRNLGSRIIVGLDRGQAQNVSLDWTARPGTTDVAAVADELDGVEESGELNNRVVARLTVPFPDMAVNITSWSPASAGAGQPLNVTASIRNDGANTSLPFRAGLYDNGSLVRSAPMAGMRAGETRVMNFTFVLGSGSTTIRFVADYDDAVLELSELNNALSFSYPNGTILPREPAVDLSFREVRLFPDRPVDGEPATVLATVELVSGDGSALPGVNVGLIVDGRLGLNRKVALTGGQGVASFEFLPAPGSHTLILLIDPENQLAESQKDNNQAFASLTVLATDPAVTGLFPPAANATDGESVSATCTVQNNGPGATRRELSVRLLLDGQPVQSRTLDGLVPGSSNTVIFTFEAFPGTHRLKAELVIGSLFMQTDVSNDQAFSVLVVERPDIVVSAVVAPASADEGAPVSIHATVANNGATTLRDTAVRMFVDGIRLGDSSIGGLFSGHSTTVIREWKALPGHHRITAVADAAGSLGESDETDNQATVTAVNVSLPDIQLSNLSVIQQPLDGAEGLVSAEVQNTGDVTTRGTDIQFFVDERQAGLVKLGGIPAGAAFSVSSKLTIGAGPHLLRVLASPEGRTAETDETDNEAVLRLNGTGFADLSLVGLKVPPTAVDGAKVRLFAEVNNTGGATVGRFTVSIFVDGLRAGDDQLDGLPAGGMASASVSWTATPGKHRVRAVVDLDDVVRELNETDNMMQKDGLSTEHPDIMVGDIAAVPNPGLKGSGQYRFFVILENIGGPTLRSVAATVYLDDKPAGKVFTSGLPARTSTQSSMLAPAGGATTISVKVDEEGGLAEGDESNNAASAPFSPEAEGTGTLPDLVVRGLWMVPPDPADGEPVRVFAAVGNDGKAALLKKTETRLSYRGRQTSLSIDALAPGGTAVVGFDITAAGGDMAINVTADPANVVSELNYRNNWRNATYSALRPELRIAQLVRPDTTDGLKSRMFGVVENSGTGDTVGKVTADIYIGGRLYVQKSIGGLLSGEQHCLAFDWTAVPGELDFVLWADRAGNVNESNPDDNRLHALVTTGYPELSVGNITWSPLWDEGNMVSVYVEVQNDGAASARPSSVMLAADAAGLGTDRLAAIAAGSRTVLSWKWALQPGNHTFSAAVDTSDELQQSNENNDRATRDIPSGLRGPAPPFVNLHLSNLSYHQSRLPGAGGNNMTGPDNTYRLRFTVTNAGTTNSSICNALLLGDGLLVAELNVKNMTFNTSVDLSFDWLAPYNDYRYKVVLDDRHQIAEDIETDNDETITISSNRPPKAAASGPYKAQYGDPVTLKGNGFDPGGFIALYEWDLDGDGLFGGRNDTSSTTTGTVTKVFHKAGTYRVSLRVTDDMGATALDTTTVIVKPKPVQPGLNLNVLSVIAITIIFAVSMTVAIMLIRGGGEVFRNQKP